MILICTGKFQQGLQLISTNAIGAILNVVRALILVAPFLEAIGGEDEEASGGDLVDNGIVVVDAAAPGLSACIVARGQDRWRRRGYHDRGRRRAPTR